VVRPGDDQDKRRGDDRGRDNNARPPLFGQQPGGQGGGRPGDDQDKRRGDDRGRDNNARPPLFGQQPGGPGGGRPGDDQDRRRGDDRDRPGGPGGDRDGRPPQFGGDRDGRPDRFRAGDRDRDRGDGGRAFEAFRPQISPDDMRRRREERRELGRERLQDIVKQRRERRDEGGRTVIEEPDARRIVRGEGRVIIRHDETARFRGAGRDFREERGPGNNRLSIIKRGNGVSVITETDNDGKLLKRYRRGADGREYVIIDNRERRHHRRGERRGGFGFFIDLPAPVVRIPRDRYYVYADRASEEDIEEALSAPPVDDIEPEYSLDEIRDSPRLRERMPSVNLNTINFEFGSWEVGDDQVNRLEVMAKAIERILRRNPDEVFLIEGHTDAVGSDDDNLSLSDRRAESVARVLSDEFNIPPENLVTQGYGEQYLLVSTDQAERANRRVEFRRITPLLARGEDKN
jgi:outer membrane protein OmpA-like peptidoglycan-associated protein